MKQRIMIHYGLAFVYIMLTRNIISHGIFYTTNMSQIQPSLFYALMIALCLTILLEWWHTLLEHGFGQKKPLRCMLGCILCSIFIMMALQSLYYTILIIFILWFICQDCWRLYKVQSTLNLIKNRGK